MLPSREYLCPKECPKRDGHCHETCKQHEKFRAAREAEREEKNRAVIADSLTQNVFKYDRRWLT